VSDGQRKKTVSHESENSWKAAGSLPKSVIGSVSSVVRDPMDLSWHCVRCVHLPSGSHVLYAGYFAPWRGVKYDVEYAWRAFVCLSLCLYRKPHGRTPPNFFCLLPVALVQLCCIANVMYCWFCGWLFLHNWPYSMSCVCL